MPRVWPICSMRRRCCTLLAGLLLLALPSACQQGESAGVLRLSGSTMGTTWSVTVPAHPSVADLVGLQQRLQKRLDRINALMSTYDPQSEISRFNHLTDSGWFPVSVETAQVIALAQEISALTDGAFDITVGPLVELWGFGATPRRDRVPAADEVQSARSLVGYQKLRLRLQPTAISKEVPGLRLDLSAIAKGYAVDELAALLEGEGIGSYLTEIGGEVRVSGRRGDGSPWRLAVEKPLEGTREVATVFPLAATALATSGNYRNFYVENGQRYAHTLDPVSGRPVRHALGSVTVLDPSCARADALATALMVMGEEKGRQFCEQHHIAAYFLVHSDTALSAYASPAFRALVTEGE